MKHPAALPADAPPSLPRNRYILFIITGVAIALSLFQLYGAGIAPVGLFYKRGIHLTLILVLAFLLYPPLAKRPDRGLWGWLVDGVLIAAAVYAGGYILADLDGILDRAGFWETRDIVAGAIATLVLLEAARRVIGWFFSALALAFVAYAYLGPHMPGFLQHRGYGAERIVAQLYLGQEGIFGLPLGVAATFVFIFVLLGAFLNATGAGQFITDLAFSLTGQSRGGPAKVAVITSALMGSISGSAIANVVTSGSMTIPLMKRQGYRNHEAGAIEAAASTGGQIMPPIMGAGAFLIAEYTGVPYVEVVAVSLFPALLYFLTVFVFVDLLAAKRGLQGLDRAALPRLSEVLLTGWIFVVPLAVLIYLLLRDLSPERVGFFAILSLIAVYAIRGLTRRIRSALTDDTVRLRDIWVPAARRGGARMAEALSTGARNAVPVSLACAVAGVIVGIVGLTGLGGRFSEFMLGFSHGNLLLAVVFVALASLVLGLGLPVTASYVVLIVLTAPVLTTEFGLPVLVAHLLVFWYSQDSNVTPPIALTAFAGAAIAGSGPMRTGVYAWKYAKGLYLIPLFFVFHPEIITGAPLPILLWQGALVTIALLMLALCLEGYCLGRIPWTLRLAGACAAAAMFAPAHGVQLAGLAALAPVALAMVWRGRRARGNNRAAE